MSDNFKLLFLNCLIRKKYCISLHSVYKGEIQFQTILKEQEWN